ncbi:hypothetical protein ACFQ7J_01120 [Streptomyces sp. NPDC056501]|uniref:hypothetical protein n=1 Tax=Streptomyces sp. NPDC056501 TaxID=3345841 RepID=UPI0036756316
MTLEEGLRVKLARDLRLAGALVAAGDDPMPTDTDIDTETETETDSGAGTDDGTDDVVVGGSLSLASGTEGTVERVHDHRDREVRQSHGAREYVRLKSLLDDFGHQMPPETLRQLEEQIGSLEPEWIAHQGRKLRVTVRVRLDNGFVLDDVHEDLFTVSDA